MIRPLWSPCENLLGLLELASLHIADKRWTYVVTTLSVALDLARNLAGEKATRKVYTMFCEVCRGPTDHCFTIEKGIEAYRCLDCGTRRDFVPYERRV